MKINVAASLVHTLLASLEASLVASLGASLGASLSAHTLSLSKTSLPLWQKRAHVSDHWF